MQLTISHRTEYTYEAPQSYGLQRVRLFPVTACGQNVVSWDLTLEGARQEAEFHDHHGNRVVLTSLEPGGTTVAIVCTGTVETTIGDGVIGKHTDYAPIWYFQRPTDLTSPGPRIEAMIDALGDEFDSDVQKCHALSALIAKTVTYKSGETDVETPAELALGLGSGVCQDHAQIFVAAARLLGFPARYVSGYLMMNDRVAQTATHAWAEVHLQGLGWVGFDVSNGISPDERYVRIATGRDYRDAAPVSGMRFGEEAESMTVDIQVKQTLAGDQVQQ